MSRIYGFCWGLVMLHHWRPLDTKAGKPAASARAEPFSLAAGKATGRNISFFKKKRTSERGRQSEYLHSKESMTDVRPPIGRDHLQIIFFFKKSKI
jgi:hypothetical protein